MDEDIIYSLLDSHFYKEQLQDILRDYDERVSGTKDELIGSILNLMEEEELEISDLLDYLPAEDLRDILDDMELPRSRSKADMIVSIVEAFEEAEAEDVDAEETEGDEPLRLPETGTESDQIPEGGDDERVDRYGRPLRRSVLEQPPPDSQPFSMGSTRPPGTVAQQIPPKVEELKQLMDFLDHWRPSKRFRLEQAYEIELAAELRSRFGQENVKTQVSIYRGRIDIEALGIGIEIKMPETRSHLQTLLGQIWVYEQTYGPNLIVVIFHDFAKVQDVVEFRNALESHGVRVFEK